MSSTSGFHRGIVVNRDDPFKAGRVQVRWMPVFVGVADKNLPWAVPADAMMGGMPNVGGTFIPQVGAIVWGFFEGEESAYPVYFAGAPSMLNGTPDIPSDSQTDYPYRKIYRSEAGTQIMIDDKPGSTQLKIQMANGYYVNIDNSGNGTENIPQKLNITVGGDANITVDGNLSVGAQGTADVEVVGATTVTSTTSVSITAPVVTVSDS